MRRASTTLFSLGTGLILVLGGCAADGTGPELGLTDGGSSSGGGSGAAAALRVRCEVRSDGPRSKISVDGRDVSAGALFSARVRSGADEASAPARNAIGDEVEFDFDSNPNDVAAGATAIAADFIQPADGDDVSAELLDEAGTVVATGAADCRVR